MGEDSITQWLWVTVVVSEGDIVPSRFGHLCFNKTFYWKNNSKVILACIYIYRERESREQGAGPGESKHTWACPWDELLQTKLKFWRVSINAFVRWILTAVMLINARTVIKLIKELAGQPGSSFSPGKFFVVFMHWGNSSFHLMFYLETASESLRHDDPKHFPQWLFFYAPQCLMPNCWKNVIV